MRCFFNHPVCSTESHLLLLSSLIATGSWVAVTIFLLHPSLQSASPASWPSPTLSPISLDSGLLLSLSLSQLLSWRLIGGWDREGEKEALGVFIETLSFTRTIITLPHTEKTDTSKLTFGFAPLRQCACYQKHSACVSPPRFLAYSVSTGK